MRHQEEELPIGRRIQLEALRQLQKGFKMSPEIIKRVIMRSRELRAQGHRLALGHTGLRIEDDKLILTDYHCPLAPFAAGESAERSWIAGVEKNLGLDYIDVQDAVEQFDSRQGPIYEALFDSPEGVSISHELTETKRLVNVV